MPEAKPCSKFRPGCAKAVKTAQPGGARNCNADLSSCGPASWRGRGIGSKPGSSFINHERAPQGGEGTLRAIGTLAHLATHANRLCECGIMNVQPSAINQLFGMSDVATQRHSEGLARGAIASIAMRDRSRNPQIGPLVR